MLLYDIVKKQLFFLKFYKKRGEHMVNKKVLAKRIKSLSEEKSITLPELERLAQYSPGTFSRWLSADETEDFSILTKMTTIAKHLGVTLDELILGREKSSINTALQCDTSYVHGLIKYTSLNKLTWIKLKDINEIGLSDNQLPQNDNGMSVSDKWYVSINGTYFLLISYCNDIDDSDEQIDLLLCGTVGHGIPISVIGVTEEYILQELYNRVRIQNSLKQLL